MTLFLSLGPFVPGFRLLIALPGFSFFRAPARWSVATSLALAILAGKGSMRCREWPRLGRSLAALAILAASGSGSSLGLVELALRQRLGGAARRSAGLFQTAFLARPWTGDPDFLSVAALARRPANDAAIPSMLERAGVASRPTDPRSFLDRRHEIYRNELGETAVILAGIAGGRRGCSTRRGRDLLPAGLIVLTFVDLMFLGRHRLVEIGPLRPLVEQSPVLAAWRPSRGARGSSTAFRNLSMLVGLEPISAYRTLDLPALEPLTALAHGPLFVESMRELGPEGDAGRRRRRASSRPGRDRRGAASRPGRSRTAEEPETIDDPALAGWLFGPSWVASQGAWSLAVPHRPPEPEPRGPGSSP